MKINNQTVLGTLSLEYLDLVLNQCFTPVDSIEQSKNQTIEEFARRNELNVNFLINRLSKIILNSKDWLMEKPSNENNKYIYLNLDMIECGLEVYKQIESADKKLVLVWSADSEKKYGAVMKLRENAVQAYGLVSN